MQETSTGCTPKDRWNTLRTLVKSKKLKTNHKRLHTTLGLFKSTNEAIHIMEEEPCPDNDYEWLEYTSTVFSNCRLMIR